jgi:thioredoxin-related protein
MILFCALGLVLLFTTTAIAKEKPEGAFFGAKETEYPAWFKESFLDIREDIEEASGSGKRLMVLFHQDGCPYCNALVERNLAQKEIETKVRENLDVVAINMWGDRQLTFVDGKEYTEKSFAEHLKVQFTPTTLFFNEQGEVILRINGYRSPQRFSVDLDYVIQHQEGKMAYRDFVKTNLPSAKTRKKLNTQDFFIKEPYNLTRKSGSAARPLAVFFEQKDCPNCDRMHSKVMPDQDLRKTIKQFDVVQLDMWSKTPVTTPQGKTMTAREWAKQLDVKYAPSIVLFNEHGEEVIRTEAAFKVFHTWGIFNYVLSGAYKEQPSFQRYLTEFADHFREQGRDVDIWRFADEQAGDK